MWKSGYAAHYSPPTKKKRKSRAVYRHYPWPVVGVSLTGVGAILRFLGCGSSKSDSAIPLISLFPKLTLVVEAGTLTADIGVIGGVDNGKEPGAVLEAVTPGTVPSVGVGEFPMTGAVGGAWDDCVATEETELDRDLLGLAVG